MGTEHIEIVADTGPLIHLNEIDALPLLRALDHIIIPDTVYAELQADEVPDALTEIEYELVEAENPLDHSVELDAGERAALSIASTRDDVVLITDDLAARETAQEWGISVHGSIGVIALRYRDGSLEKTEAAELMRALQTETSLFITDTVVERGIELLD